MPKKSKSSKSKKSSKKTPPPQEPEDFFNPVLFTSGYIPKRGRPKMNNQYLDSFADVVQIPSSFFDEKKGGGIRKIGRPKKKKKIVIKIGDKITNEKFKFSNQKVDFDFSYEGGEKKSAGDIDIDDVPGGINELLQVLPDVIEDVFEEGLYEPTDLAQITLQSVGKKDTEYLQTDWETIQTIPDSLEGYIEDRSKWFNAIYDSDGLGKTIKVGMKSYAVEMEVSVVRNPYTGSGQLKITSKKDFKAKKSVCIIKNADDLCLGRCLVIAIAQRDNHPMLKQIKMGRNIQTTLANQLYEEHNMKKEPSTLQSIMEWEEKLDCSITIIDSDNFNNITYPVINDGSYTPKDFNVYVLKDGNHFHYINSNQVAGFFCKDYFCGLCKKTYKSKDKHKCNYKCNICCSYDCCGVKSKGNNWIKCPDCWRSFPNQKCFDNHKNKDDISKGKNKGKKKKSVCERIFKCPKCKKLYDKSKYNMWEHKCGDDWCKNCDCKINTKEGHKCYMMPKKIKDPTSNYIYFDFECSQNEGKHKVNYCIAEYHTDPKPIEFLTLDSFMEWLLQEDHKGYSVIAHNGRGYDFQLIMEYIYNKTIYKPSIVYAGSKIMLMSIPDIKMRFVDSLNFLTMPLAAFPKTFGIKELKKGFFPHYFNTSENFYYKGKIPPLRYFGYNDMSGKSRKELIKFWVGKRATNYKWDQYEEMKSYCISDVDILRRSCIIFKELYEEVAGIDPFQYTTIASVCMAIFKGHHIYPNYTDEISGLTGESKTEYNNGVRNQVFKDEKIGIIPYEQQEFIRKSFFGGRTNSIKLKYTFKEDEIGVYSDITSLYPSVNYYDEYPIGHPIEITENFGDPANYFGFIDCYVIPPKGLYFPLLATKGEKLTFDLEPKRGVWTTIEINKAIQLGYKITKIYKVLHYKRRSKNIFKGYVSQFLKIKQEASGKPAWVKTESDLEKYIKDYEIKQGIKLDKNKISYNPGLRAIAKLCLNSLWGKFGQRLNMPKSEIISDSNKFSKIMFSDEYTGQAWNMIDDERMEISYKMKDEFIEDDYNTNIAIASYTTSHARLRLYWALEKLNKQVLYHDTDSVVYIYDKNNPNHFRITNGDLLGEWTDELDGVDMCGTFYGAGPKNYSYETTDGILHTKIKGFTLNYAATREDKLTHENMGKMIDARNTDKKIAIDYTMIIRDKKNKTMKTQKIVKKYGVVYDKREILPPDEYGNIDTIPFGYN